MTATIRTVRRLGEGLRLRCSSISISVTSVGHLSFACLASMRTSQRPSPDKAGAFCFRPLPHQGRIVLNLLRLFRHPYLNFLKRKQYLTANFVVRNSSLRAPPSDRVLSKRIGVAQLIDGAIVLIYGHDSSSLAVTTTLSSTGNGNGSP